MYSFFVQSFGTKSRRLGEGHRGRWLAEESRHALTVSPLRALLFRTIAHRLAFNVSHLLIILDTIQTVSGSPATKTHLCS